MTTVEFARQAGISRSTLHAIERGTKSPTPRVLALLDQVCGWPSGAARSLANGDNTPLRDMQSAIDVVGSMTARRRLMSLVATLPESDVNDILAFIDGRHADIDEQIARVSAELAAMKSVMQHPRTRAARTRATDVVSS